MSNPIRFFENLRDMYLRYLDSPFDLRYGALTVERRQLRPPMRPRQRFLEPLAYPKTLEQRRYQRVCAHLQRFQRQPFVPTAHRSHSRPSPAS